MGPCSAKASSSSGSSGWLPTSVSLVSRVTTLRNRRMALSARSTCRPSQYKLSATRLGKSLPLRRSGTGVSRGCSRLTGVTGPSERTHTSLLPSPANVDSLNRSPDADTRTNPPGITLYSCLLATRNVRSATCQGRVPLAVSTGAVDR